MCHCPCSLEKGLEIVKFRNVVLLLFGILFAVLSTHVSAQEMVPQSTGDRTAAQTGNENQLSSPNQASQLRVPAGARILVFSPHPDDETLAAGGLIQRVIEKGGHARVVIVTNGDAYSKGVQLLTGRSKIFTKDYVSYGIRRHAEALAAAAHLGLKPEDVIFLGFPDQGIDSLQSANWPAEKPYTSPYTRYNHPYMSSMGKSVKYDGADLDKEMEKIISEYAPDWVILPDPRDMHPDHSSTGIFVLEALNRLGQKNEELLANSRIWTYLVHFPGYPNSDRWAGQIEEPGASPVSRILSSANWFRFDLTPKEVSTKKSAITSYHSQLEVLGRLMRQFIRPTELFGRLDNRQILAIARLYGARVNASAK